MVSLNIFFFFFCSHATGKLFFSIYDVRLVLCDDSNFQHGDLGKNIFFFLKEGDGIKLGNSAPPTSA